MAAVSWLIRLYDFAGLQLIAEDYVDATETNDVKRGFSRNIKYALNGIDTASFTLHLHDSMAWECKKFRVIKIWRMIDDSVSGKMLPYDESAPAFAGFITSTQKKGQENIMIVNCQSPLWKLQTKFHILNHYLVDDNPPLGVLNDGNPWKQGPLMWKVIDLVNNAFGADSFTGIIEGDFNYVGPAVAPFFIGKGTYAWANIFDNLMNRPGSPDIVPIYIHVPDTPNLMSFNTEEKRGVDRSVDGLFWQYRTGLGNLDDVEETEALVPGEFANYLWGVGRGGPNSGLVSDQQEVSGQYGTDAVGVFMRLVEREEVETLGTEDVDSGGIIPIAKAEFAKTKIPRNRYTVNVSPAVPPYYGIDYNLGDVIRLDASRGALQITDRKQRIYEVGLSMSENNMETSSVTLADDFFGKVADTSE